MPSTNEQTVRRAYQTADAFAENGTLSDESDDVCLSLDRRRQGQLR